MIRNSYDSGFDAIGAIQRARAQQIQDLMALRSNYPNGQGGYPPMPNQGQGSYGQIGPTPNPWGYDYGSAADTRLSTGQTIEELFANPYAGTDLGYLKDALDQIEAARRIYGAPPKAKEGQKGDLRVIAGDRSDGVKPKEVRIDDANNYDYQTSENGHSFKRHETRFKDGTVGRDYNVTVTWEDGTTTQKRVTLNEPGQIVYMDSSW